ncbi:MAG: endonuclease/exonuclease/phosphatase family protein [Opitutaceae bacterium]|nr:endonuclease/exonuclease/phosphatase family protein [Opitutaceae bacterium]
MRIFFGVALSLVVALTAAARPFTVVAYNVENLVDLDGLAGFEEYQPARYTPAHALTKLKNIARVIARFEEGRGPDVLILAEVEVDHTPATTPLDYDAILRRYAGMKLEEMIGPKLNREIADLPAEALLVKALADAGVTGYHVVAAADLIAPGTNRPLEQKNVVLTRFPVKAARSHPTVDARAILEVEVEVDGAPLYVFANHWKSGAGDPVTEPTRIENARTLRQRLDEILRADPNADIILGGDFNSQYNQKQRYPAMKTAAMNDVLRSQGNELAVRRPDRDLYNLWYELSPEQRGSDTFRGEWGTLMHLIITRGLYDFRGVQYVDNSFAVGKFAGLNADDKGLPVRWSGEGATGSGFSDHFPVSAKFTTVGDGHADRYLALRKPSDEGSGAAAPTKIGYDKLDLAAIALTPAKVPPGGSIRTDAYKGKIFRVDGRVAANERLAVEYLGETYDVWSYDEALRTKLRAEHPAGATIRFYGELGQYRGRWQFIIQDPSWVK